MKKIAVILALVLLLSACGDSGGDAGMEFTRGTQAGEALQGGKENEDAPGEPFAFAVDGVTLMPGAAFDAAQLPQPDSVYEVPSCAIEGTDNVYNYGSFEVTAFQDAAGEKIYSVYFLEASLTTTEGLALGDSVDKLVSLYGDGYEVNGTEYYYVRGETILSVLVQGDVIISIEYRWNT